jgi:hypothetical protein
MKIKEACSSETSVNFYQIILRHIAEDRQIIKRCSDSNMGLTKYPEIFCDFITPGRKTGHYPKLGHERFFIGVILLFDAP